MGKVVDYINTLDIGEEYFDIFGKHIPEGKMFCPFHNNVNTPAAKRYGNVIHCFSCNRSYTTYDLLKKFNPQRIEDLKSTVLMESSQESSVERIKIKKVDRTKPIEHVISFLIS